MRGVWPEPRRRRCGASGFRFHAGRPADRAEGARDAVTFITQQTLRGLRGSSDPSGCLLRFGVPSLNLSPADAHPGFFLRGEMFGA
jgi:hypothetical protein